MSVSDEVLLYYYSIYSLYCFNILYNIVLASYNQIPIQVSCLFEETGKGQGWSSMLDIMVSVVFSVFLHNSQWVMRAEVTVKAG